MSAPSDAEAGMSTPPDLDAGVGAPPVVAREEAAAAQAFNRRRQWLAFGLLALVIVVLDQLAKAWVVANFQVGEPRQVIGDTLRISFIHNNGALFGLFQDQAMVFAALSLAVIALIVWYHGHAMQAHGWLVTITLGLLLGGACGNLIDRFRLGYVVDFVDMGIGTWRFYTYNVANSAITVSEGLLILMALWPRRPREAAAG